MRTKQNTRKRWAGLIAVITAMMFVVSFFAACDETKPEDASVFLLDKTSIELTVGGAEVLTLNIANVDDLPSWTSSDPSVATVNVGTTANKATVKGVGEGTALITASAGNNMVVCAVTVKPGMYITIENPTINLMKGRTANIDLDTNVPSSQLTYRSNNEAVATVSNGLVTAVGGGTATITVSGGNASAKCTVNVTAPAVTLDKEIALLTLVEGENTVQLVAESNGTVEWESEDESIATVDENGLVTAVAVGETTVTASYESAVASCTIKVKDQLLTVSINPAELTLDAEHTSGTFTATVSPEQTGDDANVTWSIVKGDELIDIDENGNVTRKAPDKYGTATVRATSVKDTDAYAEATVKCPDPYGDWIAISDKTSLINALKAENSGKSMYLTGDIDLEGAKLNSGIDVYGGTFDGRGYELLNYSGSLFINGLTGTVKNLAITTDTSNIADNRIGVICHHLMGGAKIENCRFDVTFTGSGTRAAIAHHDASGGAATVSNTIILARNPDNNGPAFAGFAQGNGKMTNVFYAVYGGAVNAGGATLKTDEQLKTAATFAGWDNDVWSIEDGEIPVLNNGGNIGAVSVTMSEDTATVLAGDTYTLTATVKPTKLPAADKAVVWTSNDENIATVDEDGVVTGVAAGEAIITATSVKDDTKSASCTVTVRTFAQPAVEITNKAEIPADVSIDSDITLTAEGNQDNGTFAWSSSDTSVAEVGNNGKLTLKAAGEVTITVTFTVNGESATDSVTFTVFDGAMIELALDARSVAVGGTYTVATDKAAGGAISWTSSNEAVATVDDNGVVRGIAVGKTEIAATIGDATDTMTIAVYEKEAGAVEVSTAEQFKAIGRGTYYIVNDIDLNGATDVTLNEWSKINGLGYKVSNFATQKLCDQFQGYMRNIEISCIHNGTGNFDGLFGVWIGGADGTIENCIFDVTFSGSANQCGFVHHNNNGKFRNIIMKVSRENGATGEKFPAFFERPNSGVSEMYLLKNGGSYSAVHGAIEKSEAWFKTADNFDESWESGWVVIDGEMPKLKGALVTEPVSVRLPATEAVAVGETVTLTATVKPNDMSADDKKVVWTSSDENIATVDENGVVTGVAAGEVTITATSVKDDTKSASCTVTVTAFADPVVTITNKSEIPADVAVGADITLEIEKNQDGTVEWSSSNEEIATVDAGGKLTLKKSGEVTITVTFTAHEMTATDSITINVYAGAKIEIALTRRSVSIGGTYKVVGKFLGGTATWSSSNEAVATVDENGVVTGVSAGTAEITATVAGTEATGSIRIHVFEKTAGAVEISTAEQFKAIGRGTYYIVNDIDLNGETITKLDEFANIDGLGYKVNNFTTAKLFDWYQGSMSNLEISCTLKGGAAFEGLFGLWISGTIENCLLDITFDDGAGQAAIAHHNNNGTVKNVIIYTQNTSSNAEKFIGWFLDPGNKSTNVYSVVMSGMATGAVYGTTKITEEQLKSAETFADESWQERWIIVDGEKPVLRGIPAEKESEIVMSADKENVEIYVGETDTVTVSVTPSGLPDADKTVTWSSDDESIATVTDGVITAVKAGTVTVKAMLDSDVTKFVEISVTVKAVTVVIDDKSDMNEMTVGGTQTLTATANRGEVVWTTSDESIATVDENGIVIAIKAGSVTITATSELDPSVKDEIVFDVKAATVDITVTLDKTEITLDRDAALSLTATVEGSDKGVTWTSSDETVATVDENGVVTTYGKDGTAIITATSVADDGDGNHATAVCTITVKYVAVVITPKAESFELTVGAMLDFSDIAEASKGTLTFLVVDGEEVVTIDESKITAIGVGTVTIRITSAVNYDDVTAVTDEVTVTVTETAQPEPEPEPEA